MRVTVVGAGVAGMACALELAERGASVDLIERRERPGPGSCSWVAGGMLAPWCELEAAEPLIATLGQEAVGWWKGRSASLVCNGTLVVAHPRDAMELSRFARRTQEGQWLDRNRLAELEPDLAGRFNRALFFESEAHVDPRATLIGLVNRLREVGVCFRCGVDFREADIDGDCIVDCRGFAARDVLHDLRGVKGEMLLLQSREVRLRRPVRVLHPRIPVYVVPRGGGLYLVGATMIESEDEEQITARSMMELLSAACAVHPAFGEAEVVETATAVRPAFPDNRPRLRWRDRTLHVNGLYRHGFLLAPALARRTAEGVMNDRWFPEVMDENHPERRCS